jgi:hypothetical protein
MSEPRYATVFCEAVMAFGRRFGEPLPKRTLEMGNAEKGWGVTLNPTAEEVDALPPFSVKVSWNGWPAGIIQPGGGIIAAGEAANEDSLIEWLKTVGV